MLRYRWLIFALKSHHDKLKSFSVFSIYFWMVNRNKENILHQASGGNLEGQSNRVVGTLLAVLAKGQQTDDYWKCSPEFLSGINLMAACWEFALMHINDSHVKAFFLSQTK